MGQLRKEYDFQFQQKAELYTLLDGRHKDMLEKLDKFINLVLRFPFSGVFFLKATRWLLYLTL